MSSMRGALVPLLGALAGVTAGAALTSETLAALLAPTPVVWDATTCAAGVYQITSTARNMNTGETFVSPPTTVKLPRPEVVQEFPNLPPGDYAVTAVLRRYDGLVLPTGTQILNGLGTTAATFEARRRSIAREITGRARSRQPPGDDLREPVTSMAPQTPYLRESPARGSATARPGPKAPSTSGDGELIQITVTETGVVFISDPYAHRVELEDTDSDGIADLIRIEINSEAGWMELPLVPGTTTRVWWST